MRFSEFLNALCKESAVLELEDFGLKEVEVLETGLVVSTSDPLARFPIVGYGNRTNANCGRFFGIRGCLRVENHNVVSADGVNHAGKVALSVVNCSCGKFSCPTCYKSAAVRLARSITARVDEASKRYGAAEHVIVSPPIKDRGLPVDVLFRDAYKALELRGFVGANLTLHGSRKRHWEMHGGFLRLVGEEWEPHFHTVAFMSGDGYAHCRACHIVPNKESCRSCGGFEFLTRKVNETDGYIVKIAMDKHGNTSKRDSVYGTVFYELTHASVERDAVRFHVARSFGCLANRKFAVPIVEEKKQKCPICGEEFERVFYMGLEHICGDMREAGYLKHFEMDAVGEDGRPNFVERECGSYG